MAFDRTRRTSDPRQTAEAAFKAATTKPVEVAAPAAPAPVPAAAAVPAAREMVTLRVERAVLEHFQKDGPGWQDRMNAVLKASAGL
ncbi:MAG: BrnA antitoxin family protein [Methylobacterium sp.]|uniref:BrnA antitoxin family protein n=1 Tax=Methylobacterium sp. TaxID=409 RepID=UPI0025D17F0B|nr:BrnA antitoxin family protein [Methylobacterium sp.]MBX9934344.1 BrnA antitoxin family protein [Methylobacterium sp.]